MYSNLTEGLDCELIPPTTCTLPTPPNSEGKILTLKTFPDRPPSPPLHLPADDHLDQPPRKCRRLDSFDDVWGVIEREIDSEEETRRSFWPGEENDRAVGTAVTHVQDAEGYDAQNLEANVGIGQIQGFCKPRGILLDESLNFGVDEKLYDFSQEETPEDEVCFGMAS